MHADEVEIDDHLVHRLVSSQFPEWGALALRRMPSSGTDNAIYRLGDKMGVRLPRIHWAVSQIEQERRWLGRLAPHLPVPVPVPLAEGEPGLGYPYPWLVYPWIPGEDLSSVPRDNLRHLTPAIAEFVGALQEIDTTDGPAPGARGGPLAPHDAGIRDAIGRLAGVVSVERAVSVWDAALDADGWDRPPVWVHGDLLPGNILVHDGNLSGIIDWSAVGVGDPACDAMLAWSLPPAPRADFRARLHLDDATWARARGWVIQQTVWFIPYYESTIPEAVTAAKVRLQAVVRD